MSREKIVPNESGDIVAVKLAADTAVTARASTVCPIDGEASTKAHRKNVVIIDEIFLKENCSCTTRPSGCFE
jgi:hypothetical protein